MFDSLLGVRAAVKKSLRIPESFNSSTVYPKSLSLLTP